MIKYTSILNLFAPLDDLVKIFYKKYFLIVLTGVLASIGSATTPLIFGMIIDIITDFSTNPLFYEALVLVGIYLIIQLGSSALKGVADYFAASNSEWISHHLRQTLTSRIFHLGESHQQGREMDKGKVLSLYSRDIESLWDLFGFAITDIVSSSIFILVVCSIVLYLNFFVGIALIIISVSFVFAFYINGVKIRKYFADASPKFDKMLGFVDVALNAYEAIASSRSQNWVRGKVNYLSDSVTRLANKAHQRSTIFTFGTSTINLIGQLVVWTVCLPGLLNFDGALVQVSLGEFVAITVYFSMVMEPLESISGSAKAITKGVASLERLSSYILDQVTRTEIDLKQKYIGLNFDSVPTKLLNIENLSYFASVDSKTKLINDISFCVYSGEMVGLAGESGSGKSTVLRIMARLYTQSEGSISFKDINIKEIPEDEFRSLCYMIPQEAFMFPVNLLENIIFDIHSVQSDQPKLKRALNDAALPSMFSQKSEVEDLTSIGLSGGEMQRISLSRAFYKAPSVLMADEPTSALDLSNSVKIANSLKELAKKGAVIVASHDQVVLEKCDKVLLLENGSIAECGTHNALKTRSKLYGRIISSNNNNYA